MEQDQIMDSGNDVARGGGVKRRFDEVDVSAEFDDAGSKSTIGLNSGRVADHFQDPASFFGGEGTAEPSSSNFALPVKAHDVHAADGDGDANLLDLDPSPSPGSQKRNESSGQPDVENVVETTTETEDATAELPPHKRAREPDWDDPSAYVNHPIYSLPENQPHMPYMKLPILQHFSRIVAEVRKNPTVCVVGDTGCGKSTQLPQYLTDTFRGRILVTQPRRVAALTLAKRVAEERRWTVGEEVGYRIGGEKKVGKPNKSKIELKKILKNISGT